MQRESNNDFFSYQGTISRKNYIINLIILALIFIGLSVVRFENFAPFITYKFIYTILMFMVSMLKFVCIMSALSVIYRRIADFSLNKPESYKIIMKRIFAILFVFPVLYDFCLKFFIDFIPLIQHLLDIAIIFVLYPLALIATITLCFIKGK